MNATGPQAALAAVDLDIDLASKHSAMATNYLNAALSTWRWRTVKRQRLLDKALAHTLTAEKHRINAAVLIADVKKPSAAVSADGRTPNPLKGNES